MVKRTYHAIIDAFNRLIEKRPFEDISVADIIAEAEVSKATFYRYFRDKYDVMNSNYKDLLDRFLHLSECKGYRDLYYNLYNAGKNELRLLKGNFRTSGINSFENYIYSYSKQAVIGVTMANRGGAGLTKTEDLQLDVFCYGISYMYKQWVLGRYQVSADDAADALYAMMPETFKHYWIVEP